jgi:hypothetical protein
MKSFKTILNNRPVEVTELYVEDGAVHILQADYSDTGEEVSYDDLLHLDEQYSGSVELDYFYAENASHGMGY